MTLSANSGALTMTSSTGSWITSAGGTLTLDTNTLVLHGSSNTYLTVYDTRGDSPFVSLIQSTKELYLRGNPLNIWTTEKGASERVDIRARGTSNTGIVAIDSTGTMSLSAARALSVSAGRDSTILVNNYRLTLDATNGVYIYGRTGGVRLDTAASNIMLTSGQEVQIGAETTIRIGSGQTIDGWASPTNNIYLKTDSGTIDQQAAGNWYASGYQATLYAYNGKVKIEADGTYSNVEIDAQYDFHADAGRDIDLYAGSWLYLNAAGKIVGSSGGDTQFTCNNSNFLIYTTGSGKYFQVNLPASGYFKASGGSHSLSGGTLNVTNGVLNVSGSSEAHTLSGGHLHVSSGNAHIEGGNLTVAGTSTMTIAGSAYFSFDDSNLTVSKVPRLSSYRAQTFSYYCLGANANSTWTTIDDDFGLIWTSTGSMGNRMYLQFKPANVPYGLLREVWVHIATSIAGGANDKVRARVKYVKTWAFGGTEPQTITLGWVYIEHNGSIYKAYNCQSSTGENIDYNYYILVEIERLSTDPNSSTIRVVPAVTCKIESSCTGGLHRVT
jgi:hypothetical protein